ncbi:hypothetical protein LA52FAK_24020 [Desulforhopalus sp. 52FAK]
MGFLLHIPVIMSFWLLAAHFMRDGQTIVVVAGLLFPLMLFYKKGWVVRVVQVALVLGVVEWIRTLMVIQAMRVEHGLPWGRLAIIIGAVALFTGCSALVFFHKSLKRKYGL